MARTNPKLLFKCESCSDVCDLTAFETKRSRSYAAKRNWQGVPTEQVAAERVAWDGF